MHVPTFLSESVSVCVRVCARVSKNGVLGRKINFLTNTNEPLNQTLFTLENVLSQRDERINQS